MTGKLGTKQLTRNDPVNLSQVQERKKLVEVSGTIFFNHPPKYFLTVLIMHFTCLLYTLSYYFYVNG